MRRTPSPVMRELDVNPKAVADLMGHNRVMTVNGLSPSSSHSRIEAPKRQMMAHWVPDLRYRRYLRIGQCSDCLKSLAESDCGLAWIDQG